MLGHHCSAAQPAEELPLRELQIIWTSEHWKIVQTAAETAACMDPAVTGAAGRGSSCLAWSAGGSQAGQAPAPPSQADKMTQSQARSPMLCWKQLHWSWCMLSRHGQAVHTIHGVPTTITVIFIMQMMLQHHSLGWAWMAALITEIKSNIMTEFKHDFQSNQAWLTQCKLKTQNLSLIHNLIAKSKVTLFQMAMRR